MKRLVILGLAASASTVVFAKPYTEGWLRPNYSFKDTNVVVYANQSTGTDISTFTNKVSRHVLMRTTAKNVAATPKLMAVSSPGGLLDGGLVKTLPEASTVRIRELARGLEYDWEKCFDFVRNYIAFSVYPGIMRGPDRTLIDREGNDADQAFLLVALLRASGHDSATVMYEPLVAGESVTSGFRFPAKKSSSPSGYSAEAWLGRDGETIDQLGARFRMAGVPCVQFGSSDLGIPHYWVAVTIDGVTKYLDPSFKPSEATAAHDALKDMGYDRNAFLSAAGGTTISGMGVRNLSASGIASKLNTLCANLRNVWTNANETAEYFVGGKKIVARTDDAYFHGSYLSSAPIDLFSRPSDYVNAMRTKTVLTCDGTPLYEFYLDEVGLRNLWVTSSGSSTVLHLDDTTLRTISTSSGASKIEFLVDVQHVRPTTHPYYLTRGGDRVYSLVFGFDGDAKNGMRKYAAEELSRVRTTGLSDSDPRMVAASLYVQGQQWLAQCTMSQRLLNKLVDDNQRSFYNIGIAGQDGGPYVDMANAFGHSGNNNAMVGADMFISSALEHSVVEQLNDVGAVSTIKILNLANQSGDSVYFVTSQNVASVISRLSNYEEYFKNELRVETSEGAIYLLPGNGKTQLNQWRGVGYVMRKAYDGKISTTMGISGGMNGGFVSEACKVLVGKVLDSTLLTWLANVILPNNFVADPVSLPSGAYHDQKVDLAINRHNPLAWGREYDSRGALGNSGLGRGWSHNYESSVVKSTDAESVFGLSTPERVVATAVAMLVVDDMLWHGSYVTAADERTRYWMVAALVTQWLTERLNNTSVSIKTGAKCRSFLKLPDGSYAPDPGDTATLAEQSGRYTLKERHGDTYAFNAGNLLSEIVDPSGNKTTLTYDDAHRLIAVVNGFDARIDITWDGSSISKVTDNTGRSVEYTYDADGHLTSVKDVCGKTWTMTYDPTLHTLVSKTDPIGQRLIYNTYNQFGQVVNQISDVGGEWSFGYLGSVSAWNEDPHRNKMQQWYDDSCHALMTRNRDGTVTEDEYDGHGHMVSSYDELGHVTTSAYDSRDNMIRLDRGTGSLRQTTTFTYDNSDRLVATTDALGNVTRLAYDACDRLVESVAADGSRVANTWNANGTLAEVRKYDTGNQCVSRVETTYGAYGLPISMRAFGIGLPASGIASSVAYNSLGLPVEQTDANGNVAQIAYDLEGKVSSATDANGAITTRTYADNGRLAAQTDALGRATSFVRSASGKVLATHFADGTSTSNRYDQLDQLVESRDARGGYALMTYDPRGRMISTTGSAGTSYVVYDEAGNVTATTNAAGEVTRSFYDELNRCVSTEDGFGSVWLTEYDKLNRVIASANPLGKVKRQTYDVLSRLSVSTSSMGAQDRFGYDAFGNLATYTNAENNVYRRFYDAAGHVLAVTNALGIGVSQLTYDGNGNLIRSVDGENHVIAYGYDKVNRLVSATGADFAIAKQYDAVGNVIRATNEEADETFSYDKDNALVAASVQVGAKTYSLAWSRDAGGLVTNITYESGKSVSRTYDLNGRLTHVTDWLGHSWKFQYDAVGRLTRLTYPTGVEKICTYDAVGRLASWRVGTIQGRTMTYDAAGRRTSDRIDYGPMPNVTSQKQTGTYNAADQLVRGAKTQTGATCDELFAHDRNGAMTNIVSAGVTTRTFAYNSRGQLAGLTENGQTVTCAYDAMGNRIRIGEGILVPDFTDSLSRPLCETSASATKYYIWANNELLGVIAADDTFVVTYCDSFSSVIAHSDMSGNLLSNIVYGPHGEIWSQTGTPLTFRWLGGYGVRQQADGLYLTRHRLYDATQQRFLSSDPMGIDGGLNLYAYGNANAMEYIDPMGLCADDCKYLNWEERFWGGWDSETFANLMHGVQQTIYNDPIAGSVARGIDAWQAYVNAPENKYLNLEELIWGSWDSEKFANRMYGLQRMIYGAGEVVGGFVGCGIGVAGTAASGGTAAPLTVTAAVAGGAAVFHGGNVFGAGFESLVTGKSVDPTISTLLQAGGVDRDNANLADSAFGLAAGAASLSQSFSEMGNAVGQASKYSLTLEDAAGAVLQSAPAIRSVGTFVRDAGVFSANVFEVVVGDVKSVMRK